MHQKSVFGTTLQNWLPLAITIIIFTGLVYVAVQQNYRSSANDPQIQNAEDIATALSSGLATPDQVVSASPTTDIAASLSPFAAIYSATGTPIGSSVAVSGKLPTLPDGVIDSVKQHGEDRFTWEPEPGVRVAAVVDSFSGPEPGYVLVGRLLKQVEIRETQLEEMSGIAGLLALVLTFLLAWYYAAQEVKHHNTHHPHSAE